MTRAHAMLAALLALVVLAGPARCRTLVLEAAETADRMAAIAEDAPLMGWAAYMPWPEIYYGGALDLQQGRGFLLRFPLAAIPKGQRITNAELIFTVHLTSGPEPRLYVWRLVADWGVGACYQYRMTRPKPVEWAVPGARGSSVDRAVRPTAVSRIQGPGEQVVNVTEDVEIWCAGAAPNQGWLITVEDPGVLVRAACPLYDPASQWKLRVTYEPE
jgi:hypothetical protein